MDINFNAPYSREDFLEFLGGRFLPDDFEIKKEEYRDFNFKPRYTIDATKLGACRSMELDVFEITHTSTHDARVGIAQDAFRFMLHHSYNNRALVIFKQEGSCQYRFSLLQIETEQDEDSAHIRKSFSNPRRYSFLLGENAHVKTPTQFLIEKGKLTKKDGSYFNDLQDRFSVEVLTKQFYRELSNWYFWALKQVEFPAKPTCAQAQEEGRELGDMLKEHNATNVIRMLTRILFVWFIKQKGLIPEELFDENELKNNILTELNPIKQDGLFSETSKDSVYYKAILQNLFFASLNCPITPQSDDEDKRKRGFRRDKNYSDDFGNDWLFRYKKYFKDPDAFVKLINSKVPFLNGGLFECLDDKYNKVYIDGFSDNLPKGERLIVPDYIFFGRDENVDLSDDYGEETPQTKEASVKGLINILKTYNFTVEENTPAEVEVALDPELLGKVFENLLASFNPETKTTARKQTGSFYTPREIVNYMVDESLISYFKKMTSIEEEKIRPLFQYTDEEYNLTETQVDELIDALYHCKILDPACGSGAFPMGVLQKLVHLLQKVDPKNLHWKNVQYEKAQLAIQQALDIEDKKDRESRLIEINKAFDITKNTPNYARKLFLIENCIYGVDSQPIATQISKLRFFISLVVDQINNTTEDNFGIVPLPNLETKFVTADTLIGKNRPTGQLSLAYTDEIVRMQEELRICRHKIFNSKTKKTKRKYRNRDKELRNAIANELKKNGWDNADADKLANWDPYSQHTSSQFFEPEWMFGIKDGFDIIIGNPPYIQLQNNAGELAKRYRNCNFKTFARTGDIYSLFYERGWQLLKEGGHLCYITSNKWMRAGYGKATRKFLADSTNPIQLIDFGGLKVFESATVDTNILLFAKENNTFKTKACIVKNKGLSNLSDYVRHNAIETAFRGSDSWIILSKIERQIKEKIERIGTPLKEWDIRINYGIKTGFNEAFIIDGKKRNELIEQDPKSAEIIRPILRGRDIKRYGYNFADLWLINTHNGVKEKGIKPIDIDNYPAIKQHLGQYLFQLEKRQDKGDTPYNLRNCAYMEDFNKQKIIYSEIVSEPKFYLDKSGKFYPEATSFIITGKNLDYLYGLLHSKPVTFFFKTFYAGGGLGNDGYRYKKAFLLNLPIPLFTDSNLQKQIIESSKKDCVIDPLIYELYQLTDEEINIIERDK